MQLSWAGVSFSLLTPAIDSYFRDYLPGSYDLNQDVGGLTESAFPTLSSPAVKVPSPEVGVQTWPKGLSRWATFYQTITETKLNQMRVVVDQSGPYQNLVIKGAGGGTITVSMRMLPPKPLGGWPGSERVYLLTLVDRRYDFNLRSGDLTEVPADWSSLFSTLGTLLGVSVTVSTVDSRYGVPSERWMQYRKPLAKLVDAAASAVGQQVVVALDGSISTINWEEAVAESQAQYLAVRRTAGGQFEVDDIKRFVPESVTTVFAHKDGDEVQTDRFAVDATLSDLALIEYGTATGVEGNTQTVYADLIYDGTNDSECEDFAAAAAEDWYGWQLCSVAASLPDVVAWTPTGAEEAVSWCHQSVYVDQEVGNRVLTCIQRGVWSGFPVDNALLTSSSPSTSSAAEPLVRVISIANGHGEYSRRYTVKAVEIVDSGSYRNLIDVTPEVIWEDVVELENCSVEVSEVPVPESGVYPLHQAPDGHYYFDSDQGAYHYLHSGSGSGSGGSGSGSGSGAAARCVTECSRCPNGMSSKYTFEVVNAEECPGLRSGVITLTYAPKPFNKCRWTSDPAGLEWQLYFDEGSDCWFLETGNSNLIYRCPAFGWRCTEQTPFYLFSNTGCDENVDKLVTVYPVEAPCGDGGGDGEAGSPVEFNAVSEVCPILLSCDGTDSDITLTEDDWLLEVDATGGNTTVTLPPWFNGGWFKVVKVDDSANTVTIEPSGSDEINNADGVTINSPFGWYEIQARCSTGWLALGVPTID